jgi:glutathionylspermidine synthase
MKITTERVQRSDWHSLVTANGIPSLERRAPDGRPYVAWDESYAYELSPAEADRWYDQAEAVVALLGEAHSSFFQRSFEEFGYPRLAFAFAKATYEAKAPDLFTRYDFIPLPDGTLKLVAVDADSVRYVVATSHVQLQWLEDFNDLTGAEHLQVNSFREDAVERLQRMLALSDYGILHVVNGSDTYNDDWVGAAYLKGVAEEAGWATAAARAQSLKWHPADHLWKASGGSPITAMLKTSAWDTIFRGSQARDFVEHTERLELLLEPAWKTITSNRGIFPLLHELHPDHPNLLPMTRNPQQLQQVYAAASEFSSAQAEIAHIRGREVPAFGETRSLAGLARKVYRPMPKPLSFETPMGTRYPIISFTAVGDTVSAMAIRDEPLPLMGNYGIFHPHFVTDPINS